MILAIIAPSLELAVLRHNIQNTLRTLLIAFLGESMKDFGLHQTHRLRFKTTLNISCRCGGDSFHFSLTKRKRRMLQVLCSGQGSLLKTILLYVISRLDAMYPRFPNRHNTFSTVSGPNDLSINKARGCEISCLQLGICHGQGCDFAGTKEFVLDETSIIIVPMCYM
jgi:hypothetical protein